MPTAYQPKIIDMWLHVAQRGYAGVRRYIPNRNGKRPKIIVIHVQEGSNWGSWQHFHAVSASCTVMIAKDGDIWRLVPEEHGPWTNGDVKSPDAAMRSIMNRWGWDPNAYSLTIEHEGFSGHLPYTDAQRKSSIWQVQTWARTYDIDAIFVVGHFQVNSETRWRCPEPPPRTFLTSLQAAVGGVPVVAIPHEVERDPWPVKLDDGTLWDGARDATVTIGPQPVTFYADKRSVTIDVDVLNGRQWASSASNLTKAKATKGQKREVLGWVEGEEIEGERRWWVDADGNRYWSGGTAETPRKQAPVPTKPSDPVAKPDYGNLTDKAPVVLNGSVYYPFEDREGDEGRGRVFVAVADGNVRTWASSDDAISPVVDSITKGDEVWCTHWVRGEKVGDEDIWAVIDDGKANPVHSGARIWMGLLNDRPD